MSVLDVLGKAAGVAGAGYQGYGVDKQLGVKNLLAEQEAKRQATNDAVANALRKSQTDENDANAARLRDPSPRVQIAPDGTAIVPVGFRIRRNSDGTVSAVRDDAASPVEAAAPKAPIAPPAFKEFGADLAKPQGATDALSIAGPAPQAPAQAPAPKPPSSVASLVRPQQAPDKPLNFAKPAVERAKTYANYVDPKGGVHLTTGEDAASKGWTKQVPAQNLRNLLSTITTGSGIGSVEEMGAVLPDLEEFERGAIKAAATNPQSATAWDTFRQKIITDAQHNHGLFSAAKAALAADDLAKTNPDLALYGRNVAAWIVSDLNLSKGATDERGRMDIIASSILGFPLSAMASKKGEQLVEQLQRSRRARYGGLKVGADKARSMMGGGAPPPAPSGGKTITRAEADALKAQGFTDAQLKDYTIVP